MDGSRAMRKALFFALCMGVASFVGCYDSSFDDVFDDEFDDEFDDMYPGGCKHFVMGVCMDGMDDEGASIGAWCQKHEDCKSGLCYESFCRAKNLKEGEICSGDIQCESEYCDRKTERCKAKPAGLQKCEHNSDCASNYCLRGFCGTYDN